MINVASKSQYTGRQIGLLSSVLFLASCGADSSGGDLDRGWVLGTAVQSLEDVEAVVQQVADNSPDSATELVVKQTEAEALQQDLELVAKAKGWTVQEAAADRFAADEVGRIAVELARTSPETFVGSALAEEPGGVPSLYVKGPAGSLVGSLVERAAVRIRVVDRQPFSFIELEKRQHQVRDALARAGVAAVTMFHLDREGVIEAEVADNTEVQLADLDLALPADLRGSVEIRFVESARFADEDIFGGMEARDDGVFECTTGWAVRDGSGVEGVTTAAHCDGINQIVDPDVGVESVTHQAQHLGAFGDIEWKVEVGDTSQPDDFYASPGVTRDTSSVELAANFSEGESICIFGHGTGSRDCSADVDAISVSCLSASRLVRMDAHVTTGGDSGGGWSWNNRAYGGHKGNCSGSVFTMADHFDSALGVNVMITP